MRLLFLSRFLMFVVLDEENSIQGRVYCISDCLEEGVMLVSGDRMCEFEGEGLVESTLLLRGLDV